MGWLKSKVSPGVYLQDRIDYNSLYRVDKIVDDGNGKQALYTKIYVYTSHVNLVNKQDNVEFLDITTVKVSPERFEKAKHKFEMNCLNEQIHNLKGEISEIKAQLPKKKSKKGTK